MLIGDFFTSHFSPTFSQPIFLYFFFFLFKLDFFYLGSLLRWNMPRGSYIFAILGEWRLCPLRRFSQIVALAIGFWWCYYSLFFFFQVNIYNLSLLLSLSLSIYIFHFVLTSVFLGWIVGFCGRKVTFLTLLCFFF